MDNSSEARFEELSIHSDLTSSTTDIITQLYDDNQLTLINGIENMEALYRLFELDSKENTLPAQAYQIMTDYLQNWYDDGEPDYDLVLNAFISLYKVSVPHCLILIDLYAQVMANESEEPDYYVHYDRLTQSILEALNFDLSNLLRSKHIMNKPDIIVDNITDLSLTGHSLLSFSEYQKQFDLIKTESKKATSGLSDHKNIRLHFLLQAKIHDVQKLQDEKIDGPDVHDTINQLTRYLNSLLIVPLVPSTTPANLEKLLQTLMEQCEAPLCIQTLEAYVMIAAAKDIKQKEPKALFIELLHKQILTLNAPRPTSAIQTIVRILDTSLKSEKKDFFTFDHTTQLRDSLNTLHQQDDHRFDKSLQLILLCMLAYQEEDRQSYFVKSQISLLTDDTYLQKHTEILHSETDDGLIDSKIKPMLSTLIDIVIAKKPSDVYDSIYDQFTAELKQLSAIDTTRCLRILDLYAQTIAHIYHGKEYQKHYLVTKQRFLKTLDHDERLLNSIKEIATSQHSHRSTFVNTPPSKKSTREFNFSLDPLFKYFAINQTAFIAELQSLSIRNCQLKIHHIALQFAIAAPHKTLTYYQAIKKALIQALIRQPIKHLDGGNRTLIKPVLDLLDKGFEYDDQVDYLQAIEKSLKEQMKRIEQTSAKIHLDLVRIIALRFTYGSDHNDIEYPTIISYISSMILHPEMMRVNPAGDDPFFKILMDNRLNDENTQKENLNELFEALKKIRPWSATRTILNDRLDIFDRHLTNIGLSKPTLYALHPDFEWLFTQKEAIQNLRALKINDQAHFKTDAIIEAIAQHFEDSIKAPNPAEYLERNKVVLETKLNALKWTSGTQWTKVCNLVSRFIYAVLSLCGTPQWLSIKLELNLKEKGNPYLFFTNGEQQQVAIAAHRASQAIEAFENVLSTNSH